MIGKVAQRQKRHTKVRRKVYGTSKIPRLSIFRSNKHIYAQIISDEERKTLVATSSIKMNEKNNIETAKKAGTELAKKALAKEIKKVVFDRGGFKFHGRVKALADGAKEGGLTF